MIKLMKVNSIVKISRYFVWTSLVISELESSFNQEIYV